MAGAPPEVRMLKAHASQSCRWERPGKGPQSPGLVELGPSSNHTVQTNFTHPSALSGSFQTLGGAPTLFLTGWPCSPRLRDTRAP